MRPHFSFKLTHVENISQLPFPSPRVSVTRLPSSLPLLSKGLGILCEEQSKTSPLKLKYLFDPCSFVSHQLELIYELVDLILHWEDKYFAVPQKGASGNSHAYQIISL